MFFKKDVYKISTGNGDKFQYIIPIRFEHKSGFGCQIIIYDQSLSQQPQLQFVFT